MLPIEAGTPVVGNKECLELAERLVERIKLGDVNAIGVAFAESPTLGFNDFAGTNESSFALIANLLQLQNRLLVPVSPTTLHVPAPVQTDIPANLVCYDINNEPVQFDFLPWIVTAKMTQIREGVPGPLKVAFVEGPTNIEFEHQEIVSRDYWMDHVIVPICRMVGAEITNEAINGRRPSCYSLIEIVEAFKKGERVPHLQVTPGANKVVRKTFSRPPITITLRESQHWPHRNSNPDAWLRFARELKRQGEYVVFVRDTQRAGDPLEEFSTYPAASRDLDIRVALYEYAKCNFFVDNGPFTLAVMLRTPWLAFVNADPMTGYIPNTPQWWKRNHGVAVGEQFPWSAPDQRIIWKPDTFENLCEAWEEMKLAEAA